MVGFGKPTALVTRMRPFGDFLDDLLHESVEIAVRKKPMRRRGVPKSKPAGEPCEGPASRNER